MKVTALCSRLLIYLLTAHAQSRHYAHKADAVFPHIAPNRLQFFEYESFSVMCEHIKGSSGWRVMLKTSSNTTRWETSEGSLNINPAFVSNSGEYWCENADRERSNSLNISVTAGYVILESPVLPVTERQTVTLRCRKKGNTSNTPADFYKDGSYSWTGYTGQMIVHNVSKSSEGLYKCKISGGESPESWLAVRVSAAYTASTPEDTTPPDLHKSPHPVSVQLSTLLPAVLTTLCVTVLVVGILQCRKHRAACFSPKMPRTESDTVYENARVPESEPAVYAHVAKDKKKRDTSGCRDLNIVDTTTDMTYAVVTKNRREREANEADRHKATYMLLQQS